MTAIPADIQKAAEIAVFAFEARIQGGEFEGLDPDGTECRDALKAEIAKAIAAERERCAVIAANHFDLRHADKARFASANIAAAIRNAPKGA